MLSRNQEERIEGQRMAWELDRMEGSLEGIEQDEERIEEYERVMIYLSGKMPLMQAIAVAKVFMDVWSEHQSVYVCEVGVHISTLYYKNWQINFTDIVWIFEDIQTTGEVFCETDLRVGLKRIAI